MLIGVSAFCMPLTLSLEILNRRKADNLRLFRTETIADR